MNDVAEIKTGAVDLILNPRAMEAMGAMADLMANSSKVTVPKHLQGSQGDCMAIVMQAMRWGMDPFAVAQKTHLVSGNLGYEAQLVNAVVSGSKAIQGRFKYEYKGTFSKTSGEARCGAVITGDRDITWGEWLDVSKVTTKNSPLWTTAPKQQAAYLCVKYWSRLYCPDVIMGVYTVDEFETLPQSQEIEVKGETISEYSDDEFDEKLPAWSGAIQKKKHTSSTLIAFIESKGKMLTDDQKTKIGEVK